MIMTDSQIKWASHMKTYKSKTTFQRDVRLAKLGNSQEQAVSSYLESIDVKFSSQYTHKDESNDWHCYKHVCLLSSKTGTNSFEFSKGLGHAMQWYTQVFINPVLAAELLYSLLLDSYANKMSHAEWCADYGYEEDSRKGLEIYLACQENYNKLLQVMTRSQIDHIAELLEDY